MYINKQYFLASFLFVVVVAVYGDWQPIMAASCSARLQQCSVGRAKYVLRFRKVQIYICSFKHFVILINIWDKYMIQLSFCRRSCVWRHWRPHAQSDSSVSRQTKPSPRASRSKFHNIQSSWFPTKSEISLKIWINKESFWLDKVQYTVAWLDVI